MRTNEILNRFEIGSPLSVMARAAITRILNSERLDQLFERTRVKQKCGELLFSTIVDLMALVAIKAKPTVHAAYKHREEEMTVAINSIYNKLQGIEPQVSRGLVRETAQDLITVIKSMKKGRPVPVLKGFTVRVVDGNHLAGTDHRIQPLRNLGAAALPGTAMVVFDPDYMVALDMIPCEDGHANELTLMPPIIETLNPKDVLIMDRGLGAKKILLSIESRGAYYVTRHNKGLIQEWSPAGPKRLIVKNKDETVWEQRIQFCYEDKVYYSRRITIKLTKKTRFGETEINLLTNLPQKVKAMRVCSAYRKRWGIETYFGQLDRVTNSEIQSLGYPQAALFSFAMGLFMLNILNTIRIAVAAANDDEIEPADVSTYHTALDIVSAWKGMAIAIDAEVFDLRFAKLTLPQLGKELVKIAKQVQLRCVLKSKRGPKKPPPKKKSGGRGNHVATSRILAESTG